MVIKTGFKMVIRPFESQTKKCPKSQMFRFQVFGIKMVTVSQSLTDLHLSPKTNKTVRTQEQLL